jgi:hypothetical protein
VGIDLRMFAGTRYMAADLVEPAVIQQTSTT